MQLSDDVSHVSYLTPPPIFTSSLEDQQPSDDIENVLMYSAAAQLKDIQTVDWNQVRIITSSDADMLSLFYIIEEGMPDHRCQLPSHLRDYH